MVNPIKCDFNTLTHDDKCDRCRKKGFSCSDPVRVDPHRKGLVQNVRERESEVAQNSFPERLTAVNSPVNRSHSAPALSVQDSEQEKRSSRSHSPESHQQVCSGTPNNPTPVDCSPTINHPSSDPGLHTLATGSSTAEFSHLPPSSPEAVNSGASRKSLQPSRGGRIKKQAPLKKERNRKRKLSSDTGNNCSNADVGGQGNETSNKQRKLLPSECPNHIDSTEIGSREETSWACPFYKSYPARHFRCAGRYVLKRFVDVRQHLRRCHTLTDGYYCPKCWAHWDSSQPYDAHIRDNSCQEEPRREGLFPEEFEGLKNRHSSDEARWYYLWEQLFPTLESPASPYIKEGIAEPLELIGQNLRATLASQLPDLLSSYDITSDAFDVSALSRDIIDIIDKSIADMHH